MKKYAALFLMISLLFACSDSGIRNNNPYLPNFPFPPLDLNLNLPQYSNLKFTSNAVFITGKGIRGVVVFNSGSGYNAFDAACPNQTLAPCSTMTLKGINLVCPCDNEEYNLFSGQSPGKQYLLKQYRVQINGDVLRVYN